MTSPKNGCNNIETNPQCDSYYTSKRITRKYK